MSHRAGRLHPGLAFLALLACDGLPGRQSSGPPPTATVTAADTIGDIVVSDPYRWLEEDDAEPLKRWVAEQNAWTDAVLVRLAADRHALLARIIELLRMSTTTQPIPRNGRYFFMKRPADQAGFTIYERDGAGGVDHRLIDGYDTADSVPARVSLLSVTGDGGILTYSVRRAGQDEATIHFFDVERRTDLPLSLPPGRYAGAEMLTDRHGAYFATTGTDGPRLWFHSMEDPTAPDSLVFDGDTDPDDVIGFAVSDNGHWLGIVVFHGINHEKSDVYVADLEAGTAVQSLVRGVDARFMPTFAGDLLLMQTDWHAPNGRVLRVDLNDPRPDHWVEIIPEPDDAMIDNVTAAGHRVLVSTIDSASSRLDIHDIDGRHLERITMPVPVNIPSISGAWGGPEVFITVETFTMPATIHRLDIEAGSMTPWSTPAVPLPSALTVRQVWVTSGDGTRVPMFLVHRSDLSLDGGNPALLTGYGAFGLSFTPHFAPEAVIMAERGGVFAVVNARGGGELGKAWHDAARGADKPRTIDDFVAAAEWLIDRHYTSPGRLAAIGTAHGGLPVMAAMVRRPELFGAVVARYPVLDMARFTAQATAESWVDEYGSPSVPAALAGMLRYSPYTTIDTAARYPAVLLIAGSATAAPVAPFHARKVIARLQSASDRTAPRLLREDRIPAGTADPLTPFNDLADALAFIFGNIGWAPVPGPGAVSGRGGRLRATGTH